jgi:hypothetical protein
MNIIIANKNKDLKVLSFMGGFKAGKGTYRVITKCQEGFIVSSDIEANSAIDAFRRYKPKTIQSIAYINSANYPLTVYARAGKKVWASECFLSEVTVWDVNQAFYNTALCGQGQYEAVNAKTWFDKAYVMNEEVK